MVRNKGTGVSLLGSNFKLLPKPVTLGELTSENGDDITQTVFGICENCLAHKCLVNASHCDYV